MKLIVTLVFFCLAFPLAVKADQLSPATSSKPVPEIQIAGPGCVDVNDAFGRCLSFKLLNGNSLYACVRNAGGAAFQYCHSVPFPPPPNPPLLHGPNWLIGSQVSCADPKNMEKCFALLVNQSGGATAFCNQSKCSPAYK
jgi:hypothetical protein